MIALTAALLLAATPAAKVDYQGPLGLKWGMSPAEVKATVGLRLHLEHEGKSELYFMGSFARRPGCSVAMTFFEGRLFLVDVLLAEPDSIPAHRRWRAIVDEMAGAYGPPAEIDVAPASALRPKDQAVEDTMLNFEVREGRWQPRAAWVFPSARVETRVGLGEPGDSWTRKMYVTWRFFNAEMMARATAATPPKRDF
jgi:hypothetical protein